MDVLPTPLFQALPVENPRGIRLIGELDMATIGDLRAALDGIPPGPDSITLDLADLSFMDVSGLRGIEGYASGLNGSRPLRLVNVPEHVRRVFEITGATANPDIELGTDE